MNVRITHKIAASYVLMVVFIIVVGSGGFLASRSISQEFFNVTDNVIPNLSGSYRQMIYLQEANEALFTALGQADGEGLEREREVFTQSIEKFNAEQESLLSQVADRPELIAALNDVKALSERFNSEALTVMDGHAESLIARRKAIEADITFQSQGDALNAWVQRFAIARKGKPAGKLVQKITKTLGVHRFQLVAFKRSQDINKLDEALAASNGALRKAYDDLFKADKLARGVKVTLGQVEAQLYGDEGLVALYRQKLAADQVLAEHMLALRAILADTQTAVNAYIDTTYQSAMNARDKEAESVALSNTLITALSIGAAIFAAVIGWWIMKTINVPLSVIKARLNRVRDGDLQVTFDDQRKDEFGELSIDLNAVVASLREILQQISEGSQKLSDVAQQNAAISQQTTHAMSEQSEQLEQTSSAAVQMEHSVEEVANHSQTTLTAVKEFEKLSVDVNQQMSNTLHSIETQAEGIDQAMTVSNEMSAFGEQIASILDSIQGIANKTNLLALNAAIEAARAGEQGRGFAVVADEVRGLAAQTRHSVMDIQTMVENMQNSIQRVGEVMNDSYDKTQDCVANANRSQDVLKSMNDAVAHIRELNAHIEEASAQQSSAVAQVSQTLVSISEAAGETAQGAELASGSSTELLDFAKQQQGLIQRFSI
ncbi:methyl-accepting chemotaxis protein [Aliamphritea ceti]|uniref:methyl-accepting chemotaxis protein n=1 Tax=Aliamphritea ceti TaxID=1524258 RepID=UPI0021C30319|nr:methyl-accepting chemotaxis protein [Aliamphritea ceti]